MGKINVAKTSFSFSLVSGQIKFCLEFGRQAFKKELLQNMAHAVI